MQAKRMWNLAAMAALCCSPMFAQAYGGGQMQQPTQPGNAGSPSIQQQQQQHGMSGMDSTTPGPATDKSFVKKALQGNMAQIEMGKLALQKSDDAQVKQFAQRMVDDHGKMQDQLKPVAEQMGVAVPAGPSKSQVKSIDKMKTLTGEAFDHAYINDMVKDHKHDDSAYKQAAESAQNPDLKQVAAEAHPIIQSHLEQAEQIAQSQGIDKPTTM